MGRVLHPAGLKTGQLQRDAMGTACMPSPRLYSCGRCGTTGERLKPCDKRSARQGLLRGFAHRPGAGHELRRPGFQMTLQNCICYALDITVDNPSPAIPHGVHVQNHRGVNAQNLVGVHAQNHADQVLQGLLSDEEAKSALFLL